MQLLIWFNRFLLKFYMKTSLIALSFICFSAIGQNIQNPSFDSVYIGGLDRIFDWITSDGFGLGQGNDTIQPLDPNTVYDASGFYYSEVINAISFRNTPYSQNAIAIESRPSYRKENGDFFESFIVNGSRFTTDNDGYIDFSTAGAPFAYRPTKLKGWYTFIDTTSLSPNFGECIVLLKKYNSITQVSDTIGYSLDNVNFPLSSNWASFEIPINYVSNDLPDSIVIAFVASYEPTAHATFEVDELSFDIEVNSLGDTEVGLKTLVYPNPSQDNIYVKVFQNKNYANYKLMDLQGRTVQSGVFAKTLPIHDISPQVLILQLINNQGEIDTFKVIKS